MSEQTNELQKLVSIASDLELSSELRVKAIDLLGKIGSHEALQALLEIAANEKLIREERELAHKQAGAIIKAGH
jgi:HEAT repeat protein